jgi:hypothetical protein
MNKKVSIIVILLLVLLPLTVVAYNFLTMEKDDDTLKEGVNTITVNNATLTYEYVGDNIWEYTIKKDYPNPCWEASVDILIAESYPEQVMVRLQETAPDPSEMCIEVIEEFEKSGTFTASEGAIIDLVIL